MIDMQNTGSMTDALPVFSAEDIDIPFIEHRLSNGLRLIIHEDHKAPVVAVNVWYHVGSKNEKPGKSGLAHLFEHLMFNGSEHYNDDYFQQLLAIGATDINGTTSYDRTNYFQNIPTAALDQVLWLESDRMGHLLGALDQAKLDEQRGVVQNEKRQYENAPYGREHEIIVKEVFPAGHPYAWTVIGSMEDLDATTVEDCHNWFRSYYGAANAVLVVAGDIDSEEVIKKVKKYFGDIPAGPPVERPELNIPVMRHCKRTSYEDRVPESRIVLVWNTPQLGERDDALLDLAAAVLAQSKVSRLHKALVIEKQIASSVTAMQWSREICGNFVISANACPGVAISEVETALHEILDAFIEEGPDEVEVRRVKAKYFSSFLKGLERIGGFGGKSDILASSAVYGGTADAYKLHNQVIAEATSGEIRDACRKWLRHGYFTLECNPFPDYHAIKEGADRTQMPVLSEVRAGSFPGLQRTKLSNGLEVVLAARKGVPTVVIEALIHAGFADDGDQHGLACLTMSMMDEGTHDMSALEINERLQLLGASFYTGAGLDYSQVGMHTLLQSLPQSIGLLADVLRQPAFHPGELERLKKEQFVSIQQEKVTPMSMAMRVLPKLLFRKDHAYAQPLTGTGYEEELMQFTRENVVSYYEDWVRPNNTTLVVCGDIEMDVLCKMLENALKSWKPGDLPKRAKRPDVPSGGGNLYFLDRPGSLQSIVIGGYLVDPFDSAHEIETEMLNDILGGKFISRINLNLREDKHWTYGARSMIAHTESQRPLLVYASVQMDKTRDAILEVRREFEEIITSRPVTLLEFSKNRENAILELPGLWETNAAVAGAVGGLIRRNLPDDYYQNYGRRLKDIKLEAVREMCVRIVQPGALDWLVVGDAEKVLPDLTQGGFRSIRRIDITGSEIHG